MSNPLVVGNVPYFNQNYSTYQPGKIYPNNLDVVEWAQGYGHDLTYVGLGQLMKVTAEQIMGASQTGYLIDFDLMALYCPSPLMLPYKNCRTLYFSWSDDSWNAVGGEIIITGFTSNYKIESEIITAPASPDAGAVSTKEYQYLTSMIANTSGESTLTADLFVDLGYTGQTIPFMPDGKCSSWCTSIQVSVSDATAEDITYSLYVDNTPRNVQTNQTPSQVSDWPSTFMTQYPDKFFMLDTLILPTNGFPYANVSDETKSILLPVPFPVANLYLQVESATTTGSLVAIFLQDSIWFK